MKQGSFEVFGDGSLGLKAQDLNQYAPLLADVGLSVPEGFVIATGIFDRLVQEENFEATIGKSQTVPCPNFLLAINTIILESMETGRYYAIRSSALSEHGGTGIYKSTFFLRTGKMDEDLNALWQCQRQVYASEFSQNAKAWREKVQGSVGMAILIQPVAGFSFEESFLPALSGVAYTSYKGLPTVRVVIGMCTKAVKGDGLIYHKPKNVHQDPLDNMLVFQRDLWDQDKADVLTYNGINQIDTQYPEIHGEIARGFKSFNGLFDQLTKLRAHGEFYLEWTIVGNQVYVVQCSSHDDRLPDDLPEVDDGHFLLLEGTDVLHFGRAHCRGIIYVHEWTVQTAHALEHLNKQIKGYLLIVPQEALSGLAVFQKDPNPFEFRHFSNALVVVERQQTYTPKQVENMKMLRMLVADHSNGYGASHFSGLCENADILFIGGTFDLSTLHSLPGRVTFPRNIGLSIWDVESEVIVDVRKGKENGRVYVSKKVHVYPFSPYQIERWAHTLRKVAITLDNSHKDELTKHFYAVVYAMPLVDHPINFDSFKLDESKLNDHGGVPGMIQSLDAVIENGGNLIEINIWNAGLEEYLKLLRSSLG
ncbi:MAG: hypothetical protein UT30_C0011G0025 [Candidatus Uhrbacteria bacterium GW2011_GWF2_39_13]|uniref:Uncharacterized protein n=1 Tax=Candidatus Uhrbacteria bacterium GW2011_GWF2_39_13 TaxID=1618995 RepID=A0A0G0MJI8_9BACT|nr:MAG: hypothetical protein UT30_C0011G0025 [Candidatus Uhrbacteria bacterium GW2011_GWF2_39_13]HAU66649.1 hypothetical protein [Candidatus Uhrbacteria bacterium]